MRLAGVTLKVCDVIMSWLLYVRLSALESLSLGTRATLTSISVTYCRYLFLFRRIGAKENQKVHGEKCG